MNKGGLFFIVALAAIAAFDYGIAYSTFAALCGPNGPYPNVANCPKPSAAGITAIPLSFVVAVVAGIGTAATLAVRWALVLWACFLVPLGAGCFALARAFGHSAFALFGVGAMLLVMGCWPLASFRKQT